MISSKRLIGLVTTQVLLSVVLGCMIGILGFIVGALVGGQFGFPYFYGLPGYEGGAILGQILGMFTGSALGISIVGMLFTERGNDAIVAFCSAFACIPFIIVGFVFDVSAEALLLTVLCTLVVVIILQTALWNTKTLWRKSA